MARHLRWVLTLILACAPAVALAGHDRQQQGRDRQQGSGTANGPNKDGRETKDGKDKPVSAASTPDDRERRKWWLYSRAELAITDQQSKDLNEIFESTLPKLRETRQELERAEDELSRAIKEHKADLATISLLIDRVESARSQNTKLRVMMLYRMHLRLSADQRAKLEALRARQDAARKDPMPDGHNKRRP